MKFFTPKIYLGFNSDDPDEADKADRQWEKALGSYRKHLTEIGSQLPASVRELAETLDLHDADYLGLSLPHIPESEGPLAMLAMRRDATMTLLLYFLAEEPLIQPVKESWPFSHERVHWLYDEFSVAPGGIPQHEVLLSSGRIITLRFHDLQIIKHEIHHRSAVA
ncbi:hypothetical protein [Candidatus Laterigemmans baculatus]|uniref:hypothetical protein n=1 Tax=Candidatus Laterigemmans baculatus TaxID=2770505 RepID=UPI0013DBFFF0|nr:hypothetical protein [Candidatus Laterigemmans baculatus]